jgi:glycosyltransferase involved in cell wall biosynthesis
MKPRILFVHNHPARFVQIDQSLLAGSFTVTEWYVRARRVNLPALWRAVQQSDLVFAWFASWHSFIPLAIARIIQRPSVLVTGGYDTANLPEIGYGSQRSGLRRMVARQSMQWATRLITNSQFACDEAIRSAGADARRIRVVYHGLRDDTDALPPPKEALVLTAGNVDRDNLRRKGLEPFTRAAAHLPEVPFVLVGAWRDATIDRLRALATPNVQFTGWVESDALNLYYDRAQVYVQASRHEAFGMALAEAMLHECVPVAARIGALPEVMGETGIYAAGLEPLQLAEAVRTGLAAGPQAGRRARARILEHFPIDRRRDGLYAVVAEALGNDA